MFWLMGQRRMVLYQSWGVVGKAQEDTGALQDGVGWRQVGRDRNIMDFFFGVLSDPMGFPFLERPFLITDIRGPAAPESDCKQQQNGLPSGQVSPRICWVVYLAITGQLTGFH